MSVDTKDEKLMPLDDVHTLLLYLLKQINDISEEENIPYFSHGGTTLGAERHKGFIPWDDDIDLIMERKYYNRFVSACEKNLPEQVVLRTRENDPFFCEEYLKVCYRDEIQEYSDLAIDIFILDNTNPKRKYFRALQNKIITWIRPVKLFKASRKAGYMKKYVPHNKFKRIFMFLLSVIPLKTLTKIQTKVMMAEKEETGWYVDWGSISNYKRATWEKSLYSNRVKLPFENIYVYASSEYKTILERGYGKDYMKLPPPEKRKTHGVRMINNSNLDLNKINNIIRGKEI